MLLEVKVPQLAESISEATVAAWRCEAGQTVRRGDILCDLETDKVTLEVAAPDDGVVSTLAVAIGATVPRDAVLLTLDTAAVAAQGAEVPAPAVPLVAAGSGSTKSLVASGVVAPPTAPGDVTRTQNPKVGPATRKLAAELGVKLEVLPQAVPGRINKGDVLQFLTDDDPVPAAPFAAPSAPSAPSASSAPSAPSAPPIAAPTDSTNSRSARQSGRVPMTRLRKRAAERLLAAQRDAALLTTFNECSMQAIGELRERHREAFEARHGVRLGYLPFFVRAVVEALRRFPIINASVDGDDILYHEFFDIGIAVAAPRGLVVPVLRDADQRSLADIELAIRDFGLRARENRLAVEDLTGGTFTITNGGVFGSLLSTPIVNPPQSAILGMHKIEQRPVAENGQVVIRPMMYVAVSYDHRIIDGRDAVSFLVAVKEYLEQPERLLLGL
ncbi:MAG TPA: dihydrolipoamide succinyltransferase [Gammaproteobacteria bacterium]|nr:dihydrolipoamide succinyltransferase [Gammaproteobacteria bacterium]